MNVRIINIELIKNDHVKETYRLTLSNQHVILVYKAHNVWVDHNWRYSSEDLDDLIQNVVSMDEGYEIYLQRLSIDEEINYALEKELL